MTKIEKTLIQHDAGVTALRTPQQVFDDIQEIKTHMTFLKRCMNDFDVTFRYPECLPLLEKNLTTSKNSLRDLCTEMYAIKAHIADMTKTIEPEKTVHIMYNFSETESRAIAGFYDDNRFK